MKLGEIVAAPSGRYQVIRKLGWGEYSTVWLVRSQSSQNYAAMKVMKAVLTDRPELRETEYLRRVMTADPTHPGFQHISHLIEDFRFEGPNGEHVCIVTELLGQNLHQYSKRFPRHQVPIAIVKSILRQLLAGLMYLHEKCNIIHTDIKTTNVLLTLPDGATTTPINLIPDKPTVKLIDLGVACWADGVDDHWTEFIQNPALRAPEVSIGAGWGTPADVWSLGILIFELATGTFMVPDDAHEISIPYMHAMLFGPYPLALIKKGKYSDAFFKEDGSQLYPQDAQAPMADTIRQFYKGPDLEGLTQFLETVFRLDPEERPTLRNLSQHPWLSTT
ncbi:kinase-like protein [Roridomyces roridus]|uniref:non-specific serine/threonine protein kinase n=1 Tax=Roridomyces roridus TaxID=1738132 RepID=A0AAD7CIQ2_9AGAR|nr:kinase-like protein [Roridomyces roridus]